MQYLLMIYEAEAIWESKTDAEKGEVLAQHGALQERLGRDGVNFSGEALMPTATALSVRKRGGDMQVSDGPFAETKEALTGFYLLEVDSMEQAVEYAGMLPHAETGTIEVRPIEKHEV